MNDLEVYRVAGGGDQSYTNLTEASRMTSPLERRLQELVQRVLWKAVGDGREAEATAVTWHVRIAKLSPHVVQWGTFRAVTFSNSVF